MKFADTDFDSGLGLLHNRYTSLLIYVFISGEYLIAKMIFGMTERNHIFLNLNMA